MLLNLKMRAAVLSVLFLTIVFTPACGQKTDQIASELSSVKPSKGNDSLYYALGYSLQKDMTNFCKSNDLDLEKNLDLFLKGLLDGIKKQNALFTDESSTAYINTQLQNIRSKMSEKSLQEGKDFLAKNKTQKGVKELPNGQGIQYMVIATGKGTVSPKPEDTVECHYVGTLINGTEFDNSVKRGQPATFPLGGVIKGWQLALSQMKEGDKWKVFIPSDLGYGAQGAGGVIPANAVLIFEVELLKIHHKK